MNSIFVKKALKQFFRIRGNSVRRRIAPHQCGRSPRGLGGHWGCRSIFKLNVATGGDALYVVENALMVSNRALIVTLALKKQPPMTFSTGDTARDGGLMACGLDISALFGVLPAGRQDSARASPANRRN
jgi:hypothetical protein